MKLKTYSILIALTLPTSLANAATFVMEKYDTGYAIDGNDGAIEEQQIYLWEMDLENENQHWVQISQGDGYYSYKKYGTSLCWDGSDDGEQEQAITLEVCDSNDYNQHWSKVKVESGTEIYRIEKRNATGYSVDGDNDGEDGQLIYLWDSDSDNENQQWELHQVDTTETDDSDDEESTDDDTCEDAYGLAECYEAAYEQGGGTVVLEAQTYYLSDTITLYSDVNIIGQGVDESIITWEESIQDTVDAPMFEGTDANDIADVTWSDFTISCTMDRSIDDERSSHHGIYIDGDGVPLDGDDDSEFSHSNITATNLEIENCADGWHLGGATGVYINNVDLHHNSVDGSQLYHNIYLKRVQNVEIYDSSFTDSYTGHGMRISKSKDLYIEDVEVLDNGDHGVHMNYDENLEFNGTIDGNCWAEDAGTCATYKCYGDYCVNIEFNLD